MKSYKSPLKSLALIVFCLVLAIILREIVRAEALDPEPVQYEVITYEEYLSRYEPSESPTIDFEVEVEQQVEIVPEIITAPIQASETYTITAYCSCEKCCGEWAKDRPNGIVIGAWGKELTPEYSVASPLPFGTRIHIEGLGIYEVQDRTSTWVADKYNGKIIDIYMGDDYQAALEFGKQVREVEIVD
jgi:3D (Asp-Asp-Asp) domain-containing protein